MILLLHIVIAIASIAISGVSLVRPSRAMLRATYVLVAATLATGTYLVVISPAHLPSACTSGLAYLAVVGGLIFAARRNLAVQKA